jgi:hypothetical protein
MDVDQALIYNLIDEIITNKKQWKSLVIFIEKFRKYS